VGRGLPVLEVIPTLPVLVAFLLLDGYVSSFTVYLPVKTCSTHHASLAKRTLEGNTVETTAVNRIAAKNAPERFRIFFARARRIHGSVMTIELSKIGVEEERTEW